MFAQQTHGTNSDTRLAIISRIAELNDQLRRGRGEGRVMITPGVAALSPADQIQLLKAVQSFDSFDEGNDPRSEHDFGTVLIAGTAYFWKIDYYNRSLTAGSPDPGNEALTTRVLTVMRADEY